MRFFYIVCSGFLLFFMATGAQGTAPRLSLESFDSHENKIVIYIYQDSSASAGSMSPLLKEIVKEALKNFNKEIAFEIYPSKTLIQHLLDKQNGLAVVGQVKDFPETTPGDHTVLPCYTGGSVQVVLIINAKNPESDAVFNAYQDGYQRMRNNGVYDGIIQRYHR